MYLSEIKDLLKAKGIYFNQTNTGIAIPFISIPDGQDDIILSIIKNKDAELTYEVIGSGDNRVLIMSDPKKMEDFMYLRKSEYDRLVDLNESQAKQLKELPGAEIIARTQNGIDFLTYQALEQDLKLRLSDLKDKYYALQYEYNKLYREFEDGMDHGRVKIEKEDEWMFMVWRDDVRRKVGEAIVKMNNIKNATPTPSAPPTKSWKLWGLFK